MLFEYCPKCKGPLKEELFEGNEKHQVCQDCRFVFYQNSKPTAAALIINDLGQILLLKRAISPSCGKWDMMGGFLKNGEKPIDGLAREAKEELGIDINSSEFFGIYLDRYQNDQVDIFTFNVYYLIMLSDQTITLSEENSEYKWFDENNIPWKILAFNQNREVLEDYFRNTKMGP